MQDPAFWGGTKLVTKVVQARGGQRRVPPHEHTHPGTGGPQNPLVTSLGQDMGPPPR